MKNPDKPNSPNGPLKQSFYVGENVTEEDIKAKETTAKKSTAFKAYLKEKGYSDNAITKITKYGGYVDGIELDPVGEPADDAATQA